MKGIVLFEDDYCLLPVTYKGQVSWMKVDDDVAAWACHRSWCLRGLTSPYAVAKIDGRVTQLHVLVNGTPLGMDTDHINGRSLDNRRENLRTATRSQNTANGRKTSKSTSSRYRGVSWKAAHGGWHASIRVRGRTRHLGVFATEDEAAAAYDAAAHENFGPFARFNLA